MRIAQIVTYVSANGAFGGPIAVAQNLAIETAHQGHEVSLIGGWDGRAVLNAPGVEVKLFRAWQAIPKMVSKFSGLVSPGVSSYLRDHGHEFEILHFQLSRDLVTLPAALAAVRRGHKGVIVQPHGMITPDGRLKARIFDSLAVREVLVGAKAVVPYQGLDDQQIQEVARGAASLRPLKNGVASGPQRQAIRGDARTVLFMARLHPRKKVADFLEAARRITAWGIHLNFYIVGPDEGELDMVREFISRNGLDSVINYEGPIAPQSVRDRLAAADIYVLPSENEPFPITVLDALAVGTPTVITATCGLAELIGPVGAGRVTDGSVDDLTTAIIELALDGDLRQSMSAAGVQAIREDFSIEAVARDLISIYQEPG